MPRVVYDVEHFARTGAAPDAVPRRTCDRDSSLLVGVTRLSSRKRDPLRQRLLGQRRPRVLPARRRQPAVADGPRTSTSASTPSGLSTFDGELPLVPRAVAALRLASGSRRDDGARHWGSPCAFDPRRAAARAGVLRRRRRMVRAGAPSRCRRASRSAATVGDDRRLPGAGRRSPRSPSTGGRRSKSWSAGCRRHLGGAARTRSPRCSCGRRSAPTWDRARASSSASRASSLTTTSGGSSAAATTARSCGRTPASACSGPPGPPSISASTSTASSRSPASCRSCPARWRRFVWHPRTGR